MNVISGQEFVNFCQSQIPGSSIKKEDDSNFYILIPDPISIQKIDEIILSYIKSNNLDRILNSADTISPDELVYFFGTKEAPPQRFIVSVISLDFDPTVDSRDHDTQLTLAVMFRKCRPNRTQ